ncbi:MAG TPA: hypothetical protein PLE09_02830 [Caldisericia bacterium]|nr:hypothetical protein [Caldisericia bacterium]
MKWKSFFIVSTLLILCFSSTHCSFQKANPDLMADLNHIQMTEDGWFVTLSNTPINTISLTNDHAFGSTDYGLLHFFPLPENPTGEILFPVSQERCLNHFVGSGTDADGNLISRYLSIENQSIQTKDLYCSPSNPGVEVKHPSSLSLSEYPMFSQGTIKFHFSSDVSSKTTALAAYTNLLFISKDSSIQKHALRDRVFQSHLNGSTYYYLSKGTGPQSIQFNALKTAAPLDSWSYPPNPNQPTTMTLKDASFSDVLQRFYIAYRYDSLDQRSLQIQSYTTNGEFLQEKTINYNPSGSFPTSSIFTFLKEKHPLLIGELFNQGEIVCINTEGFEELWRFSIDSKASVLDMMVDLTHKTMYSLLTDGSLLAISLDHGTLIENKHIGPSMDVEYSNGSMLFYDGYAIGCLNNAVGRPYRSMFFYVSVPSVE